MTLCSDEDDEDIKGKLERALEKFQKSLPEKFRTEYVGDDKKARRERRRLRYGSLLHVWDMLVPEKERLGIAKLKIREEDESRCPYLKDVDGSELFFYCEASARIAMRNGGPKYTLGSKLSSNSAQYICRCKEATLRGLCLDNFRECGTFQGSEKDD